MSADLPSAENRLDFTKLLLEAAEEIRSEGHVGWGNLCALSAEEIERQQRRVAELERATDIAIEINNGHVQHIAELEQKIEQCGVECSATMASLRTAQPPTVSLADQLSAVVNAETLRNEYRYMWLRRRIAGTIIHRIDPTVEDIRPEKLDELIDSKSGPCPTLTPSRLAAEARDVQTKSESTT